MVDASTLEVPPTSASVLNGGLCNQGDLPFRSALPSLRCEAGHLVAFLRTGWGATRGHWLSPSPHRSLGRSRASPPLRVSWSISEPTTFRGSSLPEFRLGFDLLSGSFDLWVLRAGSTERCNSVLGCGLLSRDAINRQRDGHLTFAVMPDGRLRVRLQSGMARLSCAPRGCSKTANSSTSVSTSVTRWRSGSTENESPSSPPRIDGVQRLGLRGI